MNEEQTSAAENTRTAIIIVKGFFFPKKTAARAIHPLPEAIDGIKEESLKTRVQPQNEPLKAAIIHAKDLYFAEQIPFASSTSLSLPEIRMHKPCFVKYRQ